MDLKIIKDDKKELEVEIGSLTLAEILRVYLNKDSNVEFAAWKRDHPTKNPVLNIVSNNPKKSLKSAVSLIVKDLEKVENDFSKLK